MSPARRSPPSRFLIPSTRPVHCRYSLPSRLLGPRYRSMRLAAAAADSVPAQDASCTVVSTMRPRMWLTARTASVAPVWTMMAASRSPSMSLHTRRAAGTPLPARPLSLRLSVPVQAHPLCTRRACPARVQGQAATGDRASAASTRSSPPPLRYLRRPQAGRRCSTRQTCCCTPWACSRATRRRGRCSALSSCRSCSAIVPEGVGAPRDSAGVGMGALGVGVVMLRMRSKSWSLRLRLCPRRSAVRPRWAAVAADSDGCVLRVSVKVKVSCLVHWELMYGCVYAYLFCCQQNTMLRLLHEWVVGSQAPNT